MHGARTMCGIFGFALTRCVDMVRVFKVLEKLEMHRYPSEQRPVGGYGAGVAVLEDDGEILLEKVGSVNGSPAKRLSEIVRINEASVLVGHVRMPSPRFMTTTRFRETTQPYLACCYPDLQVVSAHNGNFTNYMEVREKLGGTHTFESEKIELIDSEVIPHFFEELLKKKVKIKDALDTLFSTLQGPNAVSFLQTGKKGMFLHFIHKGKTRGLTVWMNEQDEVVFCSRREPLMEQFDVVLTEGRFKERVSIPCGEDRNLKLSLPLKSDYHLLQSLL
jgi:glucosamine 6-phosphate synthetase-like amidotransferase/phosphosugar isomerase protein